MRVFDCFPFLNELDLLEIRMELLDGIVDQFVLVEADRTFTNQPKPRAFDENRKRFERWAHKTIDFPALLDGAGLDFSRPPSWDPKRGPWHLERAQRNALEQLKPLLHDDDIVMLSDVDEIPSPAAAAEAINAVGSGRGGDGRLLTQLMHHYYLNMQSVGIDRWHPGTVVVTAPVFRSMTPAQLRSRRGSFPRLANAGWHFSFVGAPADIAYKIGAYSHQEFNTPVRTDEQRIARRIGRGRGVTDRFLHYYEARPLSDYPHELAAIMVRYPHMLAPVPIRSPRGPGRSALRWLTHHEQLLERSRRGWMRIGRSERWLRDHIGR